MNRVEQRFKELKLSNATALIPFITAGFPDGDQTVKILHKLVKNGADLIELGMPFSDPMADGSEIQLANEIALANKTTLKKVLSYVQLFRQRDMVTPIILMGYANPIQNYGQELFTQDAAKVGVDGILIVDLPLDLQEDEWGKFCKSANLCRINLIAPTTSDERIDKILSTSNGFVYVVALKGVTGSDHMDTEQVNKQVQKISSLTTLPVAVGFGISSIESAKLLAEQADAIVIGSEIVRLFRKNKEIKKGLEAVCKLIHDIKIVIKSY